MERLAAANRLYVGRDQSLRFKRYADDFGYKALTTGGKGSAERQNPVYVGADQHGESSSGAFS